MAWHKRLLWGHGADATTQPPIEWSACKPHVVTVTASVELHSLSLSLSLSLPLPSLHGSVSPSPSPSSLRALLALALRCQPVCSHFPWHSGGSWGHGCPVCLHTPRYITQTHTQTHTHTHTHTHSKFTACSQTGVSMCVPGVAAPTGRWGGGGGRRRNRAGWVAGRLGSQTARCCQLTSPAATGLEGESLTPVPSDSPPNTHTHRHTHGHFIAPDGRHSLCWRAMRATCCLKKVGRQTHTWITVTTDLFWPLSKLFSLHHYEQVCKGTGQCIVCILIHVCNTRGTSATCDPLMKAFPPLTPYMCVAVSVCVLSGRVVAYARQKELQAITEESLWLLQHPALHCPPRPTALLFPPQHTAACWTPTI